MTNADLTARLTAALGLTTPPIALAFTDAAPAGVATSGAVVPAACAFWRQAEEAVFYAPAVLHTNCPIGAMTMGFELSETTSQELIDAVGLMCSVSYITPEEISSIPSTGRKSGGIVYGPLADLPVAPEVVLLWLSPRQSMLFNEATGSACWDTTTPAPLLGRPACAALPLALANDRAAFSLGCMGMRTFTDIADDRLLAVVPGDRLGELADALDAIAAANATMAAYYQEKKAQFA